MEVVNDEQRVQIAAGSFGEPIALRYNFYACQNHRTSRDSKYLAFYNNRGIHSLFEIIEGPINNYVLSKNKDLSDYLEKFEPNYSEKDKRQFYKLKLIDDSLNIKHNGKNKKGKKTAFTMGVFRYTTIEKINVAKTTNDL